MSEFFDEEELRATLAKSLYAYDTEHGFDDKKLDEIMSRYHIRREILEDNNYIKDGKLTIKGQLIKELNGYEQIPIINIIHNRLFENLNPVQIAGIAGGLANIEYNTKDEFPNKPFNLKSIPDDTFVTAGERAFAEVKIYDRNTSELYPERELEFSPKITEHIYTWAKLNSEEKDSKKNWKNIFTGELRFSIKDEGSLFKEINMTIDLLKQMCEVAQEGVKYAESQEEERYYSSLEQKFKAAINILQREPITG